MQRVRRALREVPGWNGRWSLVRIPAVLGETVPEEERAAAVAVQLLERYGVVAREIVRREGLVLWPPVAAELAAMELRGEIRRGYFVQGLSGMQFALPDAVEELRKSKSLPRQGILLLVNACDPANPYGPGLEITSPPGTAAQRLARVAGNLVVFRDGRPVLLVESWGGRIWTLEGTGGQELQGSVRLLQEAVKLPARLRPCQRVTIETIDGARAAASPFAQVLRDIGFERAAGQALVWFP
jgi:ATP-dependent Lhr-like helicase